MPRVPYEKLGPVSRAYKDFNEGASLDENPYRKASRTSEIWQRTMEQLLHNEFLNEQQETVPCETQTNETEEAAA